MMTYNNYWLDLAEKNVFIKELREFLLKKHKISHTTDLMQIRSDIKDFCRMKNKVYSVHFIITGDGKLLLGVN